MKQRPILFSTPLIPPALADIKTQTRREITKHRSGPCDTESKKNLDWDTIYSNNPFGIKVPIKHGIVSGKYTTRNTVHRVYPPYEVGDQLWVRETWVWEGDTSWKDLDPIGQFFYKADFEDGEGPAKWKPSIFMPREASRITLEITDVKVERLNDISEEDAIAEGIERDGEGWKSYEIIHSGRHKGKPNPHSAVPNRSAISSFMELWESINGPGSWEANPWVWAVKFRRIEP